MNTDTPYKPIFLFSRFINNATTHGLRAAIDLLKDSLPLEVEDIEKLSTSTASADRILVVSDYGLTRKPGFSKLWKLPVIMELRGDVVDYEYSSFLKSAHEIQQLIDFANHTKAIVTPSRSSREKLIQADIREEIIHVLRRGVSPDLLGQDIPHRPNPDLLTLATVASLSWSKGHDRILETCVELKRRNIPFQWILMGDGPNHEWLNYEINRLSLSHEVFPLWHLNPSKIREQLATSHFFVQFPYSDDPGYCAMEASAFGIPIISTATGAIGEIYTHNLNAKLLDYQDAAQAADFIMAAFSEMPTCIVQARTAKKLMQEQYTLSHYAEGYRKLIALLLTGRHLS